jgi:hypothetical protein
MPRNTAHARDVRLLKEQMRVVETPDEPSGNRTPVSRDDPARTWRPHEKSNDEAMNVVLDYLIQNTEAHQSEIAQVVASKLKVPMGTAQSYTSGALLAFRETGWVRCVHEGRPALWRIEA